MRREGCVSVELRQLQHFLSVVECGSITDAARRLRMSQPNLTTSIRALEKDLGAPLFARSVQGTIPTEFGRSLYARARVISSEIGRFEHEVRELLQAKRGRVVIGTGPHVAHAILPQAIATFMSTHPNVEVDIREGYWDQLVPLVRTGEIEYSFHTLLLPLRDQDLAGEGLLPDPAVVITSAKHPLAKRRVVKPEDVWQEPWVLTRGLKNLFRVKLNELFIKAGLTPPQPTIEHQSIDVLRGLLREGPFITYFSTSVLDDDFGAGSLRILQVQGFTWERTVGVVYRRHAEFTPAARALLETIREACAEEARRRKARHAAQK